MPEKENWNRKKIVPTKRLRGVLLFFMITNHQKNIKHHQKSPWEIIAESQNLQ